MELEKLTKQTGEGFDPTATVAFAFGAELLEALFFGRVP